MSDVKIRKSIQLDGEDKARIERLLTEPRYRQALLDMFGAGAARSEAALLHTLLVAGLDRIDEQTADAGYAELAASEDDEDRAFHASMRSATRRAR